VIRPSSSEKTARLVEDLTGSDPVRRETAAARLAIAGERAVDRLLTALAADPPVDVTSAILGTLERIASARALASLLLQLSKSSDETVIAAVGALRPLLHAVDDRTSTQTLDALTTVALDDQRAEAVRAAAVEALADMDSRTLAPLRERLRDDPSPRIREAAGWSTDGSPANAAATVEALADDGALPDEPAALKQVLDRTGGAIALSTLHDLVLRLRDRERTAAEPAAAREWATVRAAVHQILAARNSRLALFDLRETLDSATDHLPIGFIAAAERVGDASCLDAVATAWTRVTEGWLRDHLRQAFRAILTREGLTKRHAVVKRLAERHPAAIAALLI